LNRKDLLNKHPLKLPPLENWMIWFVCGRFDAKFRSNAATATVIDERTTRAISSFTQPSGQHTRSPTAGERNTHP